PGQVLTGLNEHLDHLLGGLHDTLFATACYLRFDMKNGSVALANAGHPPPFYVDRDAGRADPLPPPDPEPALGLLAQHPYATHVRTVSPGGCVVLYTDGLYDAMDAEGRIFGLEALRDAVARHGRHAASALIDRIRGEVARFAGEESAGDDVCMIAVEITEADAPPAPGHRFKDRQTAR
ncbi:MAG: PP2C family protein-serine/threonine phosphatase, partial [Anaerolineae bacterium]